MSVETRFDAVIIGAGAAGLMCARAAGQRGRKVLILDHSPTVGRKIAISGGGRCNFTNLRVDPGNYVSDNPHFCTSALSRFTPLDFIQLIEKHGIAYHEKAAGQLFCDDRARRVVDLLLAECRAGGVTLKTGCTVRRIEKNDVFVVQTDSATYSAPALVVATGGLSYPQTGATGFGYEIAEQFGLAVIPCRPALVPLTYQPADARRYGSLSGISVSAAVATGSAAFTDALLFTHRGLSGPAILQLSSYWREGQPVAIDLLPHAAPERGHFEVEVRASESRAQDPAAGAPSRAPGPCFPAAAWPEPPRPAAHRGRRGGSRPHLSRLANPARRNRGLRQGRSHAGRGRHPRAVLQDLRVPQGTGAVFHRGSPRCHRLAGGLQFPVGLGIRALRGVVFVSA